jgi:acyl carrier protein
MSSLPDQTQILERLRRVVPERVDVDAALLVPEASLADIGIDSFSLIELVFIAEEEFNVKIPLDGLRPRTVADVLSIIERRIFEAAAS